jgi:ADP-dependent NAD(P)H-hydrate dehydratase / NAD(P)H-hydrate epimerase
MILLTAAESRELDRLCQVKYGVPSYSLMTRAGEAVARTVERLWPDARAAGVLIVAGKGNNGGDGFVAGRAMLDTGEKVTVVLLARAADLKGDALRAYHEFVGKGGLVREVTDESELDSAFAGVRPGVIIDAIFGTGLKAEVSGPQRRAIETINRLGASDHTPIVAVDIASGVDSDTGAVMGAGVEAAVTVTFGYAKYGHVSYPGAALCGELEISDIGFVHEAIGDIAPRGRMIERADAAQLLRPRGINTHKGTNGHVLIIAGGRGKSGAAILTARGALRAGAGLVTAAIPEAIASIVATEQAELMTEAMPSRDGHFDAPATIVNLEALIAGKSALIVGPGIGASEDSAQLVEWLVTKGAQRGRPLLIDADGLNVLSKLGPAVLKTAHGPVVLTPHPGEMARLLDSTTAAVNAGRIGAARQLVTTTGATVLLKGARSVIASPDGAVDINSSGNPGMGTAGMGDVLAGIVGAFLGQGMDPGSALRLGVFLHGHAADHLAARLGPVGYFASEVASELPVAISALSR